MAVGGELSDNLRSLAIIKYRISFQILDLYSFELAKNIVLQSQFKRTWETIFIFEWQSWLIGRLIGIWIEGKREQRIFL